MTKFHTLENKSKPEGKKTVFLKFVDVDKVRDPNIDPSAYKNVMFLYHDTYYGDVFLAWNDSLEERNIYFGTKGDEFYNL